MWSSAFIQAKSLVYSDSDDASHLIINDRIVSTDPTINIHEEIFDRLQDNLTCAGIKNIEIKKLSFNEFIFTEKAIENLIKILKTNKTIIEICIINSSAPSVTKMGFPEYLAKHLLQPLKASKTTWDSFKPPLLNNINFRLSLNDWIDLFKAELKNSKLYILTINSHKIESSVLSINEPSLKVWLSTLEKEINFTITQEYNKRRLITLQLMYLSYLLGEVRKRLEPPKEQCSILYTNVRFFTLPHAQQEPGSGYCQKNFFPI